MQPTLMTFVLLLTTLAPNRNAKQIDKRLSSAHSRVLFSAGYEIGVYDVERRKLLPQLKIDGIPNYEPGFICLSPDGTKFAYVTPSREVLLLSLASKKTFLLPGVKRVGSLAWSPDGKSIAFDQYDEALETGLYEHSQIFIIDLSTKKISRVTAPGFMDAEPAWSPDGKSIAFTTNRWGKPKIGVTKVGKSSARKLPGQMDLYCAKPEWSRSGIYFRGSNQGLEDGKSEIFRYNPQTQTTGKIGVSDSDSVKFAVSNDGTLLMYSQFASAYHHGLIIKNLKSGKQTKIYPDTAYQKYPVDYIQFR